MFLLPRSGYFRHKKISMPLYQSQLVIILAIIENRSCSESDYKTNKNVTEVKKRRKVNKISILTGLVYDDQETKEEKLDR
jgi:hypothetical protein